MSKAMPQFTSKKAYPNLDQMQNIPGAHDTNKWIQAVKTIYYLEKKDEISRSSAIKLVTKDWNVTEVNDFINWLKFYEEGAHLKYKTAQFWYGNADVGYLLPIKQDPKTEEVPQVSGKDIDFARDATADELSSSQKKKIIEMQRNKIIGRLDSAEKLLRSQEGQLFADNEFASLLEIIYDLKKKIHMVNKKSSSVKLYDDMIVREANKLSKIGFNKAADLLYSLANGNSDKSEPTATQPPKPTAPATTKPAVPTTTKPATPTTPKPTVSTVPSPTPPAPPSEASGNVGGLPAEPTPAPTSAPEIVPQNETPESIRKFLEGLETGNKTKDKNSLDEDVLEVIDSEDDLIVEAQVESKTPAEQTVNKPITPSVPKDVPVPKDVSAPKDVEIKENDIVPASGKDFDNMIDSIFSNLKISDVVAKFEDIAKFYKTREMPRQLAMADMMLDSLGLAPFFPALAEATNKALEANNYISTRLEDIISKLRGTMKTRDIDMDDKGLKKVSPELEQAKQILKEKEEKELAKKQMRKDLEEQSLKEQVKETPEIEIEEDLSNPPSPQTKLPESPVLSPKPVI